EVMTNKKVAELDAEAKASMDALEKKIDDGIRKLDASIKAMKEESNAKIEELKQLILGTAPSQSTHVDHVPQITKVAAKTAPYVPPIRRRYDDLGFELHNAESSTTIGKNLRPKSWDVEGSNKLDPGTTNDMNGERLKSYTDFIFVEGMQPTGLNNAMELVVSIEDNQLYEGVMQSKGVVAIVRQTTSKGDNFRRMTEPEIQDRKAKGLCFRCEEKYTPGHQCASRTLQVMLVDESDEAEEPDFNFKSWDRGSKID
nr:ankyrin repeat-containing protein [Tanacetum cinerariifolium]